MIDHLVKPELTELDGDLCLEVAGVGGGQLASALSAAMIVGTLMGGLAVWWIALAAPVFIAILIWALNQRSGLVFTRGVVATSGRGGRRHSVKRLRLSGEPGRELRLLLKGHQGAWTLRFHRPDWRSKTFPQIRVVAQRIAKALEVPLDDMVDRERWERWHEDAAYRLRVRYDRDKPRLPVGATRPEAAENDHDEVRLYGFTLKRGVLRAANGRTVALTDVREVHVRLTAGAPTLWVLLDESIAVLSADDRAPLDGSGMVWLAKEVQHAASRAEPMGDAEDVPEQLRKVQRAQDV